LHVCNLIIGMLFVVIGFSTYSPNTCYREFYPYGVHPVA
jgi:hypothetical protein